MGLSDCRFCGGHIPLGPDATNICETCGKGVFHKDEETGGAYPMTTRIDRMRAIAKVLWPELNKVESLPYVGMILRGYECYVYEGDVVRDFLFPALAELAKRGPYLKDSDCHVRFSMSIGLAQWKYTSQYPYDPTDPASHIDALLAAMAEACGVVAEQSPADEGGR